MEAKTWAHFAPSKESIHNVYQPVDFDALFQNKEVLTADDLEGAFLTWSRHVETAVDKAISAEHRMDPRQNSRTSLQSSFKGRCNFKHLFYNRQRLPVRSDCHDGYTPP